MNKRDIAPRGRAALLWAEIQRVYPGAQKLQAEIDAATGEVTERKADGEIVRFVSRIGAGLSAGDLSVLTDHKPWKRKEGAHEIMVSHSK
jgi:hypothetical protein